VHQICIYRALFCIGIKKQKKNGVNISRIQIIFLNLQDQNILKTFYKNTPMNNILHTISHLWKNKKPYVITFLVVLICFFIGGQVFNFVKEVAATIEAMTLIVLVFLWYNELEEDRQDKLEKRLTVIFQYQGKPIMVCENAYLAGKSDIRAWGQQLGLQMSGLRSHGRTGQGDLEFEPFIEEDSNLRTIGDKQYMHFSAVFTLRSIPYILEDELQDAHFVHWICRDKKVEKLLTPFGAYAKIDYLPPLSIEGSKQDE
jgi:hypothetical protein